MRMTTTIRFDRAIWSLEKGLTKERKSMRCKIAELIYKTNSSSSYHRKQGRKSRPSRHSKRCQRGYLRTFHFEFVGPSRPSPAKATPPSRTVTRNGSVSLLFCRVVSRVSGGSRGSWSGRKSIKQAAKQAMRCSWSFVAMMAWREPKCVILSYRHP